jgi:alkylation response protein AidB-like acyl-CoA dehydrogenase
MMDQVFFAEARGYYGIPGTDIFGYSMLAPTLLAAGSEEVKRKFLPGIASADTMGCELWSEPNAGSDLASLTTTAIRKGDEYIINGQKTWTSGAHRADWGFGVFKTDPTAPKHHNLSFLLVEDMKAPGITVTPILYMDMGHLYNEVYFDDVHVPAENIVGEEGKGWQVTQVLAGFERSNLEFVMMMQRQLEDLVKYCNETRIDGELLAKNPLIRNRLAGIACDTEAARCLAYRVADLQDKNQFSAFDASAVKVFAGELGERMAFLATDILGPYGQVKSSKWAPLYGFWEAQYQQCFVLTISMGTNEIQKNIISWYGLGLPRMK